jgi:AcrR family transcriptional regulator
MPSPKARERILKVATSMFSTQGYARTTTQAIAKQANVAEVTLFRHFGSKQGLFEAVTQEIGSALALGAIEEKLTGDIKDDLILIGQAALHFFSEQRPTIAMLMFESSHFPEMQEALAYNPRQLLWFLGEYFKHHIENRHLEKSANHHQLAQAFTSLFFGYAIGLAPIKTDLPHLMTDAEAAELLVTLFLQGATSGSYNG